ncbi:Hsp70 family protein, partial [Candidatus Dependentiae bacterium]|nr:Hsp70 family protein [Candidatus Dependentiae bacterium]
AEDRKAREVVEKKNRLDGLILDIEKTLSENKEKLAPEDVQSTEAALEKAKTALKEFENDSEGLQKATDELLQASHKVAEILYKQESSKEQPEAPEDQGPIDINPEE